MKKWILIALLFPLYTFGQPKHVIIGTYTGNGSKGIYVFDYNGANGSTAPADSVATSNPSFVALAPGKNFVYAVNEDGKGKGMGMVSAFSYNRKTGKLSPINQQPSGGDHPCYITVDKTGKWVLVGNYSSGSLSVLPIQKDGSLGEATTTITHSGSSVNKDRQESAHVHATMLSADNKYLFVPDLGMDQLMVYRFDAKTGKLTETQNNVHLQPGSGPRHISFHPKGKWAYLTQEMGGTITAFSYSNGKLKPLQTINMLPADYKGAATVADIHVSPDGRFVYASNRDASNTIAIFRINQQNGKLSLVGHQSTLGRTPRNFNFDPSGNFLLVANQNTNDIEVFKVDHKTGKLTHTDQTIMVFNPVCVLFD